MTEQHPWLANYPEGVDWNHKLEKGPLYSIIDKSAAKFPDNNALDFLDQKTTYKQLADQIDRAAKGFQDIGVKKGTRVGLLLPNTPHAVIAYYGILKAGGTVVNYSPLYSKEEIKHQVELSKTEIMVTLDLDVLYPLLGESSLKKIVVGNMPEVLPTVEGLKFIAINGLRKLSIPLKPIIKRLDDAKRLERIKKWFDIPDTNNPEWKGITHKRIKGKETTDIPKDDQHISWKSLLNNKGNFDKVDIDADKDIAVIQFTGGTTGVPKGAMLSHNNLYANTQQIAAFIGKDLEEGKEKVLVVLPLFHVFAMTGVMNVGLENGSELILRPKFELEDALDTIDKKKPTLFLGVPMMLRKMNEHPDVKIPGESMTGNKYDLTSIKVSISGGAPLPLDVGEDFSKLTDAPVVEGYGLTETAPVLTLQPLSGEKKFDIGFPVPHTIIKIEDLEKPGHFFEAGETDAEGKPCRGELCAHGPQIMLGYLDNPEATAELIKEDGFFRTGDIAIMHADGRTQIVDRKKEMIIVSGLNVYPSDVEKAIQKHEKVSEVAVIGVPDPVRGEKVLAFVALKPGESITAEELRKYLKDHLAKYKLPSEITFMEELPKTAIGKIDKKALPRPGDEKKVSEISPDEPSNGPSMVDRYTNDDKGQGGQVRGG